LTLRRHFWRNHGRNQQLDRPGPEVHNFNLDLIIDQTIPVRRSAPAIIEARPQTGGSR